MSCCAICGRLAAGFGLNLGGALGVNSAHCSMRCLDAMYALVKVGRKPVVGVRGGPLRTAVEYVGQWVGQQPSSDLATFTQAQAQAFVGTILSAYCWACVAESEAEAGLPKVYDAPPPPLDPWHHENRAMVAAQDAAGEFIGKLPYSDLAQFTQADCDGLANAIVGAFIKFNDGEMPF